MTTEGFLEQAAFALGPEGGWRHCLGVKLKWHNGVALDRKAG